jgi:deoxyribodipyrimidine photo-lyase
MALQAVNATGTELLEELAAGPRVALRRGGAVRPDARAVVYWMQRAVRIGDNPALELAIQAGNLLSLPVVVFFSVIPAYPNANLRSYYFLQQALRDCEQEAAARGVGFVVRVHPDNSLPAFLEETRAALLIGDENPCREPERWRQALAKKLKIPFFTVDADVVVPSRLFNRSFALLHHFRPHLKRELPRFLVAEPNTRPLREWQDSPQIERARLDRDLTAGFKSLDRTVAPVDGFPGGERAARQRLAEFMRQDLRLYETQRNHPETRGTSRLSPYLHFGNISPVTIALAVEQAARDGLVTLDTKEKFLDQLIGWRELSVLFVRHEPNYDSWECAAPWARKTILEHASDARPARYTLAELECARTRDELWNAAQREMLRTGWMHNYLRMYWAKKILEWAPSPEHAFSWAVQLNDRYQLDGRDPNGYAGIAWAIVGRHDRPWFNRPVFGLVRPMSEASTRKKFDAVRYIRMNAE